MNKVMNKVMNNVLAKKLINSTLVVLMTTSALYSAEGAANQTTNLNDNSAQEFVENSKESVAELKNRLNEQVKNLKRLQNDVKDVEFSLVVNSKKYQKLVEERAALENSLQETKKNLDLESENLKRSFQQTKGILGGVILHRLDKNEKSSDLLSKKILIEMLQKRIVDLGDLIRGNNAMKKDLAALEEQYQQSLSTEKELVQIVQEMELRKNELREIERTETEKKAQLEKVFSEVKNRQAIERHSETKKRLKERLKDVQLTEEIIVADTVKKASETSVNVGSGDFQTPLKSYQDFTFEKKGITYRFNGKNEIRAPKPGAVVYTGVLSTFGNVVMIDHGDGTRSVLLGHYDYYVKNGDKVDLGALIGHTKATNVNPDADGKLYYEIRKNNIAQNTYLLLDKRSLPKNFLR